MSTPVSSTNHDATHLDHTACQGNAALVTAEEAVQLLSRYPGWSLTEGHLTRTFTFTTFGESMAFVKAVAAAAEELNHHPNLTVENKLSVGVILWTHKLGGLTSLDFALAAHIDTVHQQVTRGGKTANPPQALTRVDEHGAARMADPADRETAVREAVASAAVTMLPATLDLISQGAAAKGDVLAAARIAGIMAAKRTADLIPLCHPLALDAVSVDLTPTPPGRVLITARVRTSGCIEAEMEAMTAAAVAGLTVVDMCKAVDRGMEIVDVHLDKSVGGSSTPWLRGGAS